MATVDPHPAFPSAQSSAPIPIPTTSEELYHIVQNTPNPDRVINALHQVASGSNQAGKDTKAKIKKGEEIICLSEWNIEELDDPGLHELTGAMVYILSARAQSEVYRTNNASEQIFDIGVRLCNVGQPVQFARCLDRVGLLAMALVELGRYLKKEQAVIAPLYSLLKRSAPPGVFTPAHTALLEAILLGRAHFAIAREIIDSVFVDFQSANPSYVSILTFYLHAGTIAAAQGQMEKARNLFLIAIVAPSHGVSAIQSQCAKRAVLCELVISGKLLKFPTFASQSVGRFLDRDKSLDTYIKHAKYYEARDWSKIESMAKVPLFKEDQNLGLVRKVIESVPKKRIRDRAEVYTKMRVQDLADMLGYSGLEGCERIASVLRDMITSGEIGATIIPGPDLPNSIIKFRESDDPATIERSLQELKGINALSQVLEHELTTAYRTIGISETYLKKQWDNSRARNSGPAAGAKSEDFDMLMGEAGFKGKGSKGGKVGMDLGDQGY